MKEPKISVVIPLYNHEKFIREALCSVLKQTVPDFELIIINDGSSDRSEEVVRQISDRRIRYFSQENQGAHKTINKGIQLSRGEFVSILNSDDVYDEKRLEEILKIIESDHSIDAVFSLVDDIDEIGNIIQHRKGAADNWKKHDSDSSFKGKHHIVLDLLAGNFLITTSNLFCRKSVFEKIGYFRSLTYAHDYDFFLRLCYRFNTHLIDFPLLKYRKHDANTYNTDQMLTRAGVEFELGLILADFFRNHDLKKVLPDDDIDAVTAKFFSSVNPYHSERIIMTLMLFSKDVAPDGRLLETILEDPESAFKKACISYYHKYWQGRRETRALNSEQETLRDRLVSLENELREKNHHVASITRSFSYRLGRLLTLPFRKLRLR